MDNRYECKLVFKGGEPMKVSELIDLLQGEDVNAVVKIARYDSFYGWDRLSNPTVGS